VVTWFDVLLGKIFVLVKADNNLKERKDGEEKGN
jgi:hypothetical protein